MTQQIDEEKRQRSAELCQLVHDRQFDGVVGYEIRNLLEEGVLIDFQDQNRNKKTAIHLAVDNCDVVCVKFLLQFRPNLEVKDEDGKTPVELARLCGYQNILNALLHSTLEIAPSNSTYESIGDQNIQNVLLNSTVDGVDESYVEVIDFNGLTRQKIEAIKSRETFKVLKLTNCPSVNHVWMKLKNHGITTTLNESSHLFFIAIGTKEMDIQNNHKLMKKVVNLRRPMIIQLRSSKSQQSKIYFKDDKKDFDEITGTPQITQEEFNEALQSKDDCNLKLLVAALRSNMFGHFTVDLLETKLTINEDRNEAVNQFAKSNALCHRFFKLFDENHPDIDRIIATLSFKGDQSLLALLDLPFEPKEVKLKLDENQQEILNGVDSSGCNLLMMAVEQSNLDAIKLLLRFGSDFNHSDNYKKHASDICWKIKAFDCLAELIEAGSPYPNDFRIDELDESPEAYERINAMIDIIKSFHEHIERGETEEVKKFIKSHHEIKHAFDTTNKCALTVALQSNEVDIYSLLLSEGFEPGADDEYRNACCRSKFKSEIRNSHRKYFREAFNEPHLKRLLKLFRLSFGSKDRAKCSTIIRKMFDELNQIDEVIPILKICSLSEKLRIVFDFNCDSVVEMDPISPSNASGAVYPIGGFIYIGAKNHGTEFCQVIGNLIHELTHYAMKLTYGNCCKPYNTGDIANENRFEDVTIETKKICGENSSTDSIVTKVFSLYKQEVWHQELIVRVPHLLAHYKMNPKALTAAERITPELFHFYRETTLKDVAKEGKALLHKYLIDKINKQTGITRKIENLNVQFEKVEIDLKPSVNVITSNAPQLTLSMLHQAFPSNSPIFVTLEQVALGMILDKISKINSKESSTALIVDCIGLAQKYPESVRNLLRNMKNIKAVALVMTDAEGSTLKENFPKFEFKTFTHKWAELTECTKVHLLDQNVIFQGIEMKLNELVGSSSVPMDFFPLSELLDCKEFRIGHELHQTSHKFYIARKFMSKYQGRNTVGDIMIISDDAGSGKSVTLFNIAKSLHEAYPNRWILFVDLKRHIEAFKCIEDFEKIKSFEDFIVQNILKNESEFDRQLFLQMLRNGKTFILFDGFDEISPNFKMLLLHALKLFHPGPGNQLCITTRPHLESDLENALGNFVFKLEKFSRKSQIDFLTKYFESVGLKLSYADFKVLSKRLLEKFSEIKRSAVIGLPLLTRMTAEIFSDGIEGNILDRVDSWNVASLFKQFVDKYLLRWTLNASEISLNENVEFVRSGGIFEVHHKIALNHIFGDGFAVLEVDHSDFEKIARVGLIRYDQASKTFQFIHETFAEYFVADFICYHLEKKGRDPSHNCQRTIEVLCQLVEMVACFGSSYKKYFSGIVIRTFLDQTLDAMKINLNEVSCQSLAKCFAKVVKSQNCFYILSEIHGVGGENISNILLSIVRHADKNFLQKILESRDRFDRTPLLEAAKYQSSKSVSILCNIIETFVDDPKRIFQQKSGSGNVLSSAARNKNRGVVTVLCESLNSVLTTEEFKIMIQASLRGCIINGAVNQSSDEVLKELLALLRKYFSAHEQKTFLQTVDYRNRNCFHDAVESSTKVILKSLINFAKGIFDKKDDQKAFFQQPSIRRNFFHLAAENKNEELFQTLIESTCDVLSNDDFRSMLMEKDSNGSNVLHLVALNTSKSIEIKLKALSSLLRKFLSNDDLRCLLLQKDGNGESCVDLATNATTVMNLQVFRKIIGNLWPQEDQPLLPKERSHEYYILRLISNEDDPSYKLPNETIKSLLTKKNGEGRNMFQDAAFKKYHRRWTKLAALAQARFSADEMKTFLFCGQNCLHLAIDCPNTLKAVCGTIKSIFRIEDQNEVFQIAKEVLSKDQFTRLNEFRN